MKTLQLTHGPQYSAAKNRECLDQARDMLALARTAHAECRPAAAALYLACAGSVLKCATFWRKRYRAAVQS